MRFSILFPTLLAFQPSLSALSQPPITNTSTLPTHYGLLIFPHYQALDIFGPMDLLNSLFMIYGNATQTPHLSVLSKTIAPVTSAMTAGGFGQEIVPTTTFTQHLASREQSRVEDTTDKGDIDVLVVPGGGGTRSDMSAEIDFVKLAYPKLKYIISICTGATILARAHVLDNKRATTNKRSWTWATSTGPNVTWVPTARWVEDGNVFTSSGVSAGTDAMYAFVSRVYGEPVAKYMSLSLEYERVVDWQQDDFARVWDVPGAT